MPRRPWPISSCASPLSRRRWPMPRRGQTLDLTGPAALRPFVVKGLVDAGRTVLVVAATVREAEDLTEELKDLLDPASVALYPAWETLPARAPEPSQRHGRTSARGAAPAQAPGHRGEQRPAQGRGRAGAVGAPATGEGSGRPRAGRAGTGSGGRARGRRTPARRRGVLPRRPRREAGRVRRARWHRRRLPADRGAPPARGVLRRRDRRDPGLRRRRPAHPRAGRPPLGAAVPRAPAHRRRQVARSRARRPHPQLAEITDKLAQGIAVEGMESLSPALVDEMEMLVELLPRGHPRARPRPRARAHPRARPRRHQRGVPRRELGCCRLRRTAPSTSGPRPCAASARCVPRCWTRPRRGGGSARSGWTSTGESVETPRDARSWITGDPRGRRHSRPRPTAATSRP